MHPVSLKPPRMLVCAFYLCKKRSVWKENRMSRSPSDTNSEHRQEDNARVAQRFPDDLTVPSEGVVRARLRAVDRALGTEPVLPARQLRNSEHFKHLHEDRRSHEENVKFNKSLSNSILRNNGLLRELLKDVDDNVNEDKKAHAHDADPTREQFTEAERQRAKLKDAEIWG